MSYNQIIYNRSTYNRSGSSNAAFISVEGFENINALVGIGTNIFSLAIANEHVRTEIHGGRTIVLQQVMGLEQIYHNHVPNGIYWLDLAANEKVHLQARSAQVYIITSSASETVAKSLKSAFISWLSVAFKELISSVIDPRAELWIEASGYELADAVASAVAVEESACIIEVTLHPGDRLVVDSDSYLVLLNGENVIETHHGSWFDELDRNTTAFSIRASEGTENLTGRVLFTERFL